MRDRKKDSETSLNFVKLRYGCRTQRDRLRTALPRGAPTGQGGHDPQGTDTPLARRLSEGLDCEILYEPSVFQGTGAETRLNIVIRAPESAARALHGIEEAILPSGYISCLRDGAVRAKIDVTTAKFYDSEGEVSAPSSFRQACNAFVEIKGTYSTRQATGLLIEVTALQLGGVKRVSNPFK